MSWGYKILFLYLGFVVLTLVLVVMSYRHDVPLVSDDYYEKELKYQDQINMMKNAVALKTPIKVEYDAVNHVVNISFPPENSGKITGTIRLMRPSDPGLDTEFQVEVDDLHQQQLSVASLHKGLWNLKIYWENAGKKYMKEEDLVL